MKKILIVDDEKVERSGLRYLLKEFGDEVQIYDVENGRKACSILMQEQIDIMLTDIKMPFMSGLELTKKARELQPDLQIAIFSGYGQFEYAKEAIKYGVSDYILKPVNPSEFRNTIEKMILACNEKEREQTLLKDNEEIWDKFLIQRYLYTGKQQYLDKAKKMGLTSIWGKIQNIMLLETNHHFFEEYGQQLVDELEHDLNRSLYFLNLSADQVLLAFYQSASDNYLRIANYIHNYIKEKYKTECFLAVSREIKSVDQLPKAFAELERLLENKFYRADMWVFYPSKSEGRDITEKYERDIHNDMINDIRMKDVERLKADFQKFQTYVQTCRKDSKMYLKFICSEVMKVLYEEMDELDESRLKECVEKIYLTNSLNDIFKEMERSINEFASGLRNKDKSNRDDVEKIKKYIYHNYGEDLSVDSLAEKVFLSPGYLSYIFKKETGENLSRFIKECRIEKAKELLSQSNMKIVQICKCVGFKNVSYFCQNFKEYCGTSPERFRRGENMEDRIREKSS